VKGVVALLALTLGSSACSMLLGLDDAEFDSSFENSESQGGSGGAADASGGSSDVVAGSAGAGGGNDP
jgi:hypothetical protein